MYHVERFLMHRSVRTHVAQMHKKTLSWLQLLSRLMQCSEVVELLTQKCTTCMVLHLLQVQPFLELFDTELPFNRVPMHDKVQELAAGRLSTGMPGSLLNSYPLSQLHPASW